MHISMKIVLDDLEPCLGVVDGVDMVLEDVWRPLHCLIKILANSPDLIYRVLSKLHITVF